MKENFAQRANPYLIIGLYISFFLLFISMAFSLRAISSISIGLIFLFAISKKLTERRPLFYDRMLILFAAACFLFYLLQFVSSINRLEDPLALKHLRIKSALLFIPIALGASDLIKIETRNKLLTFFSVTLLAASLYCLGDACVQYYHTKDVRSFFYYELINPFDQHAIYFSIMVFISAVFLLEKQRQGQIVLNKSFQYAAIVFFSVFLFLLSSRLVISFYLLYLLYYFITKLKKRIAILAIIISVLLAGYFFLFSNNPVSYRFKEIAYGDLSVVREEKFDPGDYFGGLQFRLLYWRFVPEILSENQRWLTGVSPVNSQSLLDKKYMEKDLYIGEPSRGDTGFLGYNTHSQFLESLLQTGLIGLFVFIFICFILVKMIWLSKDSMMTFVTMLLLIYSLIESLFETQYGILLFLFFPLFLYSGKIKETRE